MQVGGDEFVVIITSPCETLKNIETRVRKAVKNGLRKMKQLRKHSLM